MAAIDAASAKGFAQMRAVMQFLVDNGVVAGGNSAATVTLRGSSAVATPQADDADAPGGIPLPTGITSAVYDRSDASCTIVFVPLQTAPNQPGKPYIVTGQA